MAKHKQEIRIYARQLFVEGNLTAKEISARLVVNEKTIGKWKEEEDWDGLKSSFTITKPKQLQMLYAQIADLNELIATRDKGSRHATSKEADILVKYAAAINNLETEMSVSNVIEVSIRMASWLKTNDLEESKRMTNLFDRFIKSIQ